MSESNIPAAPVTPTDISSEYSVPPTPTAPTAAMMPQAENASVPFSTDTSTPFRALVYAIGQLQARFSSLGAEREFMSIAPASELSQTEQLRKLLRDPETDYLSRGICWVLSVQNEDVMTIAPDAVSLDELVGAMDSEHISAVCGHGELINGCLGRNTLQVSPVHFLSFGRGDFVDHIAEALDQQDVTPSQATGEEQGATRPSAKQGTEPEASRARAQDRQIITEFIERVIKRTRNTGLAPEMRALNYLTLRYPPIYRLLVERASEGFRLAAIETSHRHAEDRSIVDIRLVLRNWHADIVSRYSTRVDVTDVFPFLSARLELVFDN
jgi:hypothetical protein